MGKVFLIPLNERHLRGILKDWVAHYNKGRPLWSAKIACAVPNKKLKDPFGVLHPCNKVTSLPVSC